MTQPRIRLCTYCVLLRGCVVVTNQFLDRSNESEKMCKCVFGFAPVFNGGSNQVTGCHQSSFMNQEKTMLSHILIDTATSTSRVF